MKRTTFADHAWGDDFVFAALKPGGWTLAGDAPSFTDSRDQWVVFAQADAFIAPGFERAVAIHGEARPDIDLFHGDDAALGDPVRLRLKPAFNLPLLAAGDYIGAPLAIRASALTSLGLRTEAGEAMLYDLVLRAQAAGKGVERIPHVMLAYPGARPAVPLDARRAVLSAWAGTRGLTVADGWTPSTLQLARRFGAYPDVTLVVPTRQSGPKGRPYIIDLLDSLKATDWPMDRLQVLIGDDLEDGSEFSEGRWPFRIRRISTPRGPNEPFNYAAKMNRLWREAATEHLVFVNDDVTVGRPDWLKALMTFAMDADVGGCGARLLFPDGRLQHAGMPMGLFGGVAHAWVGQPGDTPTYQDWAVVHRDWSVVTGAVFATRRSVMEAAGGFDERFSVEFNDVDLCLRLRTLGWRIVCTPFAEGVHREKASRGETPMAADQLALFVSRWREMIADDPAYHPGLTRDGFVVAPKGEPDWFDR